jgi:hypothetical protein
MSNLALPTDSDRESPLQTLFSVGHKRQITTIDLIFGTYTWAHVRWQRCCPSWSRSAAAAVLKEQRRLSKESSRSSTVFDRHWCK